MPKRSTEMVVFDTETTSVDVESALIVTAFIALINVTTGVMHDESYWVLDHGVEIPIGASDIHGYTTERVRAEGRKDVDKALMEIATRLDAYDRKAYPVVIYNAPYDLTVMDRNLRSVVGLKNFRAPRLVHDPLVLDKAAYRFRKGKGMRQLTNAAPFYGVEVLENAHDARADCLMAGQIALKQINLPIPEYRPLAFMDHEEIHHRSISEYRKQMENLKAYFLKTANSRDVSAEDAAELRAKAAGIDFNWPMIPFHDTTAVTAAETE